MYLLTKEETEFVTDGLVYLILQAEREFAESLKLKDEETREHVTKYLSKKIRSLQALKAKF